MRRLILAALIVGFATAAHAGSGCTGADDCKACKTCTACKHCHKEGGTCGVLKQRQPDPAQEPVKESPKNPVPTDPKPRTASRRPTKRIKFQPWKPIKPFKPIKPKIYKAPQLRRRKDGTYYWSGMPKKRAS